MVCLVPDDFAGQQERPRFSSVVSIDVKASTSVSPANFWLVANGRNVGTACHITPDLLPELVGQVEQ